MIVRISGVLESVCTLTMMHHRYEKGSLLLLDQLKLPFVFEYMTIKTCEVMGSVYNEYHPWIYDYKRVHTRIDTCMHTSMHTCTHKCIDAHMHAFQLYARRRWVAHLHHMPMHLSVLSDTHTHAGVLAGDP